MPKLGHPLTSSPRGGALIGWGEEGQGRRVALLNEGGSLNGILAANKLPLICVSLF